VLGLGLTQPPGGDKTRAGIAEQFSAAVRHFRAGNLAEAERLCRKICSTVPDHAATFHLLGMVAHQRGREDAADLIGRAVALAPDSAEMHNDFGVVLGAHGRVAEAVASFSRATEINPRYTEARINLGVALARYGRPAEASAAFEAALAINPRAVMVHFHFANVLRAQGQLDEAAAHYRQAVAIDDAFAVAHYNLAVTAKDLGQFDQAVAHYRRALALQPNSAEGHNNLGLALKELGRIEEATAHFYRALALRPDFAGAHNNLANALRDLGGHNEAAIHYDQACTLAPDFAPAHYNRGLLYRKLSRIDEAAACFEQAVASAPDFLEARFALCMAQLPIVYHDEAEIVRRRALYESHLQALHDAVARAARPRALADAVGAHQPFYLAYQGACDRDLQSIYGAMVCRIMTDRYPSAQLPRPPTPAEPVRVGFVSGFFRRHSNWKIPIKGWLTKLDRRQFHVFGYHTGIDRDDETEVAAASCERFVQGPLAADDWRAAILQDAPHVLIYPEIGMDPMSARLAAQRLAPVQCVSWGHPDTGGFPTLDYYLSSELMEPPGAADHYAEKLVCLPNLSIHYEPPAPAPVSLSRIDLGLRSHGVVFWCGQAIYKYLPQFDEVFPRIAREVGDCQFVFIAFPDAPHVTAVLQTRLERAFADHDLDAASFCVVLPRLDPSHFAGAMGLCDIMLDSIGWSGCNSTLEGLAHDLPIVTLPGSLMRGRHTAAMLRMMDVADTVAKTLDDYVSLAIRLARDESLRAAVKSKIARNKHRVYGDVTCVAALETFLNRVAR
jgi:predicted O-linked N-acetylglucosamine transferase (SPINDLY family)